MHLPGRSWFTRADQIFVHVKFFGRFSDYILYIIYYILYNQRETCLYNMRVPGRGASNFTYYKIHCSSCKAGKAAKQLESCKAAGKLRLSNFKSS